MGLVNTFQGDFFIDAKTAQIAVEHVRERQKGESNMKCDDLVQILTGPLVLENHRLSGEVKGLEERLEAEVREKDSLSRQLQQLKDARQHCRYF